MDKVIPVVVIKELADTIPTLKALKEGGVNCAEITFRTACAAEAIALGAKEFPDMNIGAGTVINAEQCERALAAGAKFIVSPGLSVAVAKICKERGVAYYPGCVTPTEIMQALELGIEVVKFFPCSNFGGLATIKALSAAFPAMKFMPTGGISASNMKSYLDFNKVIAIGGSWMVKGDLIAAGQFDKIKDLGVKVVLMAVA